MILHLKKTLCQRFHINIILIDRVLSLKHIHGHRNIQNKAWTIQIYDVSMFYIENTLFIQYVCQKHIFQNFFLINKTSTKQNIALEFFYGELLGEAA